jgi:hypothetical protein
MEKQYRFRINEFERLAIISALENRLNELKKDKENYKGQYDKIFVFDILIMYFTNLIEKFKNPKRGQKKLK